MKIIILAAGIGSRLGSALPKSLVSLKINETIMGLQLKNIDKFFDVNDVMVVVGFKKEMIMETFPNLLYVYNPYFERTNTSKSLLKALRKARGEDVLWINGDVVFNESLPEQIKPFIRQGNSFVCVNNLECGEEEVKYKLGTDGSISEISKTVVNGQGEAVGINFISHRDLPFFIDRLEECGKNDFFERGLELMIKNDRRKVFPVNISSCLCMEVDFEEDLERVNKII
ncbi:MAG: NTP transferase domain-containing protein [Cytophagaceae bacterium]|jgi:choline kinase|nr:NTP transferase domain-containing protein [Cytophagaceae bacterium]